MLSLCTTFMAYRKFASVKKNSVVVIWYVNRKNCVVKTFYCVFITAKENYHIMKPFNNYLLYSLFYAYLFGHISLFLNFQQVYSVGERLCYYMRLFACMCVCFFYLCLVSNLLDVIYKCYVG